MGKNSKKRLLNRKLKRAGIGMKWQRHFESEQEWSEAVNKFTKR